MGGYVWRYAGESYTGEYAAALKKVKVIQYSQNDKKTNLFNSVSEAANKTGCSYEGIRMNVQGKAKSSGGFIWKWDKSF